MERDFGKGTNGFKLKGHRFGLDIRKTFFPGRVGRSWHKMSREAVAAPESLQMSMARLDAA